jgi:hypothetical protein
MAVRWAPLLGVTLLALFLAGCDDEASSPGERSPSASFAPGDWEHVGEPPGRLRGPQELAPVLAGDRVVLIAGVDYDQSTVKALTFDARSGRWTPTAQSDLWWRTGYTAVAAGDEVILWGGCCGPAGRGSRAPGAVYDPVRDRWTRLAAGPPGNRSLHTAVWTGEEMIVWGGAVGRPAELRADGAAYDPRTDSWRSIAQAPLSPRLHHVAVWTGKEMIVWGGSRPRSRERERLLYDGAAYDPDSDSWRLLARTRLLATLSAILPAGAEPDLQAVWTGEAVIVWGPNGGAAYDPDRDRWERIPTPPATAGVTQTGGSVVWTGEELVVWGGVGSSGNVFTADGATYDPRDQDWTALPPAPISGRDRHAAIWTGDGMLVWGGCCRHGNYHRDGGIYVPD